MRLGKLEITRTQGVRILADAIFIQLALSGAFFTRFLLLTTFGESRKPPDETAAILLGSYARAAVPIAIIGVAVFSLHRFYSNGRLYRGRYRYLWILQSVAVTYASFAGLAFMINNWFQIPRGVIPLAFTFTAVLVVGARVASSLWASVLKREGRLQHRRDPAEIKIETVLVIGGAGYIGSALLPRLLESGYRVRLLDLLLFGEEPIRQCINHPRLEVVQADFRQIDRIVEATRGVDAVIHLGGIVGDPACAVDEALTIDINLTATRFIGEVARGEGVQRFIFASTCSVYGSGDEILNENSALRPLSLYARTKLASERVLLSMAGDNFSPVILRFGTIYGLSGRTRFDLVVNLLTAKSVKDRKITVFGGDQWRPFVHVEDAARAVFAALEAPLDKVKSEVFNVGSNQQNYTISQVGELIHKLVPSAELVSMGSDTDKRNYRVNFDKIRDVLGFQPEWTVERGVQQVIRAFSEGLVVDYTDARYSNLKALTEEHNSRFIRTEQNWPLELLAESSAEVPAAAPAGLALRPATAAS